MLLTDLVLIVLFRQELSSIEVRKGQVRHKYLFETFQEESVFYYDSNLHPEFRLEQLEYKTSSDETI